MTHKPFTTRFLYMFFFFFETQNSFICIPYFPHMQTPKKEIRYPDIIQ